MLQKMGYKSGQSLGKEGTQGLTEPVKIEVKAGRAGLGRDKVLEEIREQKERHRERRRKRKKEEEMTVEEYR